jgi:MFS transporter, UMF1 family
LSRLVPNDALSYRVFAPIALIFLACAFPAMFLAPDFPARPAAALDIAAAYGRIRRTLRQARRHRYLFRFLIGDFLYENAIASVITLMGLYSRNIIGFTAAELTGLFGPSIVVAMLSAWFVFGPLTRAIGPKKSVLVTLTIWLLLFATVLLVTPGTSLTLGSVHLNTKQLFTVIAAPLAGLGLAGVWSSSRVLLTAFTPAAESGEIWGLYNLSGRTASVIGDATWSLILTLLGEQVFGYRIAVIALALYVVLGFIMVATLPDVRPSNANFAQPGTAPAGV